MNVKVYTDKNLHRAVAGGWNLKGLAEGKIGTLVRFFVEERKREKERRKTRLRD